MKIPTQFWPALPFLLLGSALLGWSWMVREALNDPGFAVERDYYQKAVDWDRDQLERAQSDQLGWRASVLERIQDSRPELLVRLETSEGAPVAGAQVQAEAFANARSADRRQLAFVEVAPGSYAAQLERARPGLWEIRVRAERQGPGGLERFTSRERLFLGAAEQRLGANGRPPGEAP